MLLAIFMDGAQENGFRLLPNKIAIAQRCCSCQINPSGLCLFAMILKDGSAGEEEQCVELILRRFHNITHISRKGLLTV